MSLTPPGNPPRNPPRTPTGTPREPDPIPFSREHRVEYGTLETLRPGLRRITCNNPGPFTFQGTGTYVIGEGRVAVVDPGPADPAHIDALLRALGNEVVTHILVTHTHHDHSPGCALLQARVDAETWAFGPHGLGRRDPAAEPDESGDWDFHPDRTVVDGEIIQGDGWRVECVHTPGHTANHLCFANPDADYLLAGDHVMGWSTTIVSPPDGHMGDYMASLERLQQRREATFWPTHGGPIESPQRFVRACLLHRQFRAQQVLEQLEQGRTSIAEMLPVIYGGIDPRLHPAAARSLYATMIYLVEQGEVTLQDGHPAAGGSDDLAHHIDGRYTRT